jgi:hypothetical protein
LETLAAAMLYSYCMPLNQLLRWEVILRIRGTAVTFYLTIITIILWLPLKMVETIKSVISTYKQSLMETP